MPKYHGWRVVGACFVVAIFAWSLALFGPSVYIQAIHLRTDLAIPLISSAVTAGFLLSAFSQVLVGASIDRLGSAPVMSFGALLLGSSLALMAFASTPFPVFCSFLLLGAGWACLSTTAISTTIAPWFERHQGRAMSTALMGASVGGIVGTPLLIGGFDLVGMSATMMIAGGLAILVVLSLAWTVLRHRGPRDLGLAPDGLPLHQNQSAASAQALAAARASAPDAPTVQAGAPGAAALATVAADASSAPEPAAKAPAATGHWAPLKSWTLGSLVVGFGVALMVQVGFLTHHVGMLLPMMEAREAAWVVSVTAVAALIGRILLARFSDGLDVRKLACCVLAVGAATLGGLAVATGPWAMVIASVGYGLTVGNVTTLPPMIVRREFGAASFGAIYGSAAGGIQLLTSLGPGLFGYLFGRTGNYRLALGTAVVIEIIALAVIWSGRRR